MFKKPHSLGIYERRQCYCRARIQLKWRRDKLMLLLSGLGGDKEWDKCYLKTLVKKELALLLFHCSCCFVSPGWWMKLLSNICLPSATFPPSAHVCEVLPSSTKKVHKPSQGVALGAEGCSLASRTKFYVNKQHVSWRSICSGLESWLLLMVPGLEHWFSVPRWAELRCVTQV